MKRTLLLCCAFLPMLLNAQSFNVLDTHPAHNTGKMISQEAANSYGVSLAPERFRGDIPEMGKRLLRRGRHRAHRGHKRE